MHSHPTIVEDFLRRTLRPLRSPTLEDTDTWLRELGLLQSESFNEDTTNLLVGLRHRLLATELFLRGDERRSLIELNIAIALFESLGNKPQLGRAFLLAGNCYHGMGAFADAQVSYQKALELFDECEETDGSARAQGNLGNVHNFLGEYPQALECYLRAFDLHEQDGTVEGMARTLTGIGLVHANLSDYASALQYLTRSLELYRSSSDKREEARVLSNLANVYRQFDEIPKALSHFHAAKAIIEDIGEKAGLARILTNISGIYEDTRDHQRQLEYSLEALGINERTNDAPTHARILGNISCAYVGLKNFSNALTYIESAIEESERLGIARLLYDQKLSRATILMNLGRLDESRAAAESCLDGANKLGLLADATRARIALGSMHNLSNDKDGALACFELALSDSYSSGDRANQTKILDELAVLLESTDPRRALECFRKSVEIEKQIFGEHQQRQITALEADRKLSEDHKLHEQHRSLLIQLMPDEVVARILHGEKLIADTYEDTSVMFLDIVGFTDLASHAPANHLVYLLNAVFELCDVTCEQYGLTKIKTIGDSYLAISGMPTYQEDHASRLASAAIALKRELGTLNIVMPSDIGPTDWINNLGVLDVRIGLHSGPLVAGVIGKKRAQYDVWGDTVNVASRMESTSQPGRIQVTDAFAEALCLGQSPTLDGADVVIRKAPFLLRLRGKIDVKGKGEMKTWWLESAT